MSPAKYILVGLSLCLSCGQTGQREAIAEGDVAFVPDSMAVGILLRDTTSALKVIGPAEPLEDHVDMPRVTFMDRDSTEIFAAFVHYGGYRNEYCEFRISEAPDGVSYPVLDMDHFASGRGVRLGMSEEAIISLFGNDFSRSAVEGSGVKLSYAITDIASSGFLQRFNYPSYYAHFTFGKDGLIEYRFGFEYP